MRCIIAFFFACGHKADNKDDFGIYEFLSVKSHVICKNSLDPDFKISSKTTMLQILACILCKLKASN